jgi:hypothetical protein
MKFKLGYLNILIFDDNLSLVEDNLLKTLVDSLFDVFGGGFVTNHSNE